MLDDLSVERRAEVWRQFLAINGNELHVAVVDARIVGFAATGPARPSEKPSFTGSDPRPDPNVTGELVAVYVEPSLIGQVVGSALMDGAEAALERPRASRIP